MEKVCIVCPRSCMLNAELVDGEYKITGNNCKRGPIYLKQELVAPKRMLTTSVKVIGGTAACVPVHATEYVDKDKVKSLIAYLKSLELTAPIINEQVIANHIGDYDVTIKASMSIDKK